MAQANGDKPVRVAVFDRVYQAEQAIEALLLEGFEKDQLSVVCSDPVKEEHFKAFEQQQAGESAPRRAAVGGALGATLGGLATITALITTGGIAVAVAGHFVASMAGGGIIGGFVGAMTSRGVDKEAAEYYEQSVEKGKILVVAEDQSEDGPGRLRAAEKVFVEAGAQPVALHSH